MLKVIFGAGVTGKRALKKYGKESIDFFVDNDSAKDGTEVEGIPVIYFGEAKDRLKNAHIIVACKAYKTIERQLEKNGIFDYEEYGSTGYIDIPEVVLNPYAEPEETNKDWIREEINNQVKGIKDDAMFNHVEIETLNRCNGVCSFCPVNRNIDPRKYERMDENLFKKIIDELASIEYSGKLALFSNNEPLLDDRILDFHKYAREKLPKARMHLCTNGTLLTIDIFKQLMLYLDELIIDNYNKQLKLISNAKAVVDYCELYPEFKKKVTVILRKPDEVLTNRGGDAPNCKEDNQEGEVSCLLPYKQVIVRPDGKISLCCNDALGRCTLGDLNIETIIEIWYGNKFKSIRNSLKNGRKNFERCKNCNTLFLC